MANVIDLGLLNYLMPIFVWAFVFVILFAIFEKFKVFGDKTSLHSLIAFIFATLFILVKDLREIITVFTPFVVVMFVVVLVILIALMLLGITQQEITKYVIDTPAITVTVVIIILILFFIAISQVAPNIVGYPETNTGTSLDKFRSIIFHPKVLGVGLVLVILAFVVRNVGYKQ